MKRVSLVTVLWNKTGLKNHDHIPSLPDTPHPSPSFSPIYRPICSANCSISSSLYYWTTFLPYFSVMHTPISEALLPFLSLLPCLPSLPYLVCSSFPSLSLEVHRREKKEMKENTSDAPTCIWLSISMVAWPPETADHASLHSKRTERSKGEEEGRLCGREGAVVMN